MKQAWIVTTWLNIHGKRFPVRTVYLDSKSAIKDIRMEVEQGADLDDFEMESTYIVDSDLTTTTKIGE